jgi:hypothetical protein
MTHLAFLDLHSSLSDALDAPLPHFPDIQGGGVLGGVFPSEPEELIAELEEEDNKVESEQL